MIKLKRVYEKPEAHDGTRFLIERLWPRGVRKADVHEDGWVKDAGPSDGLRKWFSHDPEKWTEFQRKYFAELDTRPEAWEPILKAAKRRTVTLLYSSHDTEHNNAVALKRYIEKKVAHASAHRQETHHDGNEVHQGAGTGASNDSKGRCDDVRRR